VGYRSPSRRPKSTTPSPTTAPYELRPDAAKLINFIPHLPICRPMMARLRHRLKAWGRCPWPRTARRLKRITSRLCWLIEQRLRKAGGAEHNGEHGMVATATDRMVGQRDRERDSHLVRPWRGSDNPEKRLVQKRVAVGGRFRTHSGRSLPSTATAAHAPKRSSQSSPHRTRVIRQTFVRRLTACARITFC
jgi:hypothetical protein